jgi:hypothetical protein
MDLRQAKKQGIANMIELNGDIIGYTAGIGITYHAVAKSKEDLKALVADASVILCPDIYASARNHKLMDWLLKQHGYDMVNIHNYDLLE